MSAFNLVRILPALCGALVALAACGVPVSNDQAKDCTLDAHQVKYFRRLAEVTSLAEPLIGVFEVSPEKARTIVHFRITYNGCAQISEFQYYHGEIPKPIDENFASNRYAPASRVSIEYDTTGERRWFYDNAGEPKTVFGNVSSIKLIRDADHNVTRAELFDAKEQLVDSTLGFATLEWEWANDELAVETRFDAAGDIAKGGGEFPFEQAKLTFNTDGFVETIMPVEFDYQIKISRNDDLTRRSWQAFNHDGAPARGGAAGVSRIDYSYDENGYLVRAKYLDEEGVPLLALSGHMGFQRIYNEAGNRLAYHFLDENDQVWSPPARGYAGQIFRWNDAGVVRISTSYVNADEAVINHPDRGYATITYEFDERNRVTERHFLDAQGRPVEPPQ